MSGRGEPGAATKPACDGVPRSERLSDSLLLGRGRPQHGELVRDLDAPRAEAEERGWAAASRAGWAPRARSLDHAAPQQDAVQVRRRDVVPQRRGVEVPELRDRE